MDNQQESSKFIRISWLAGIIDGEGTITLTLHERKNQTPIIKPKVTLVNTDEKIINKVIEILKENNFPFWVSKYQGKGTWKDRWVIEISGIKRLMKFLPEIKDYLVGKNEEANLVLEWCERRFDATENKHKRLYYTKEDVDILMKVKKLHGHQDKIDYDRILKSSETICRTQEIVKI